MEGDIASVGEDGNVNILNSRRGEVQQSIKGADSCSLHSVCFIKLNEVFTVYSLWSIVQRGNDIFFYKIEIDEMNKI